LSLFQFHGTLEVQDKKQIKGIKVRKKPGYIIPDKDCLHRTSQSTQFSHSPVNCIYTDTDKNNKNEKGPRNL
jgi:hypothetical protein